MHRYFFNIISSFLPPVKFNKLICFLAGRSGINMEKNVSISSGLKLYGAGKIIVGENSWIGLENKFYANYPATISIGKNCDIGPGVKFITGTHEIGSANRRAGKDTVGDITIEDGVWIGANAVILPSVTIGRGSLVAAGSVVIKSVYPNNSLIAGNPAKIVKDFYD